MLIPNAIVSTFPDQLFSTPPFKKMHNRFSYHNSYSWSFIGGNCVAEEEKKPVRLSFTLVQRQLYVIHKFRLIILLFTTCQWKSFHNLYIPTNGKVKNAKVFFPGKLECFLGLFCVYIAAWATEVWCFYFHLLRKY